MYCSKCGEADQNVNSYCRKCGSFRLDSLKKEMTILLTANFFILACCLSILTLWILTQIFELIDGDSFPNFNSFIGNKFVFGWILIYVFGNVMFFVGVLRKMSNPIDSVQLTSEETQTELTNLKTKDLLSPADFQSVIPSVVEETTRNLNKVRRK